MGVLAVKLFLLSVPDTVSAGSQQPFGVYLEQPSDQVDSFYRQLQEIRQLQVEYIIIEALLPQQHLAVLEEMQIPFYVQLPVHYPVVHSLRTSGLLPTGELEVYADRYGWHPQLQGVGLFRYGMHYSDRFAEHLAPYASRLRSALDQPLFYVADARQPAGKLAAHTDFIMKSISDQKMLERLDETPEHLLYRPTGSRYSIRDFQSVIREARNQGATLVVDYQWLQQHGDRELSPSQMVQAYAANPNALFANPREEGISHDPNWPVLHLLLIWTLFAICYSVYPTYRKSLLRYFQTHIFFVNDILEHRLRIAAPNSCLLIIQGLLAGTLAYLLAVYRLPEEGLQAFLHYLPFLSWQPASSLLLFLTTGILVVALNALWIGWYLLASRHIEHLSQASTMILWPQHLNLFIVTVLGLFLLSGVTGAVIQLLGLAWLAVFLGSFPFAVLTAGRTKSHPFYFYLLTLGLYAVFLLACLYLAVIQTGMHEAWMLAQSFI